MGAGFCKKMVFLLFHIHAAIIENNHGEDILVFAFWRIKTAELLILLC
jgi:hypothetical protein